MSDYWSHVFTELEVTWKGLLILTFWKQFHCFPFINNLCSAGISLYFSQLVNLNVCSPSEWLERWWALPVTRASRWEPNYWTSPSAPRTTWLLCKSEGCSPCPRHVCRKRIFLTHMLELLIIYARVGCSCLTAVSYLCNWSTLSFK